MKYSRSIFRIRFKRQGGMINDKISYAFDKYYYGKHNIN